ncbi:MAG: LicD family protein [Cellulosilyticaceae bacterium]
MDRFSENSSLKKAQKKLTLDLIEIDRICEKYNITYWLDWGTLLGAVRHKGFIPWDDDIDILMPKDDYEKFIKIVEQELPEYLYLLKYDLKRQNKCKWIKIKDKRSVFIEWEGQKYDKHIFIDIFPADTYKNINIINKWVYKKLTYIYAINNSILYTKKGIGPKVFTDSKKDIIKKIIKTIIYYLTKNIVEYYVAKIAKRRDKNDKYIGYFFDSGTTYFFKKAIVYPLKKIEFEGYKFPAPNNVDLYLKELYGDDYMQLPAIDKRKMHHIYIDVEE